MMSIFAAFAQHTELNKSPEPLVNKSWLENSSFQIDLSTTNKPAEVTKNCYDTGTSSEEYISSKNISRNIKHKRKKEYENIQLKPVSEGNETFTIDTNRIKEYLTVSTISRPAAPKYTVKYHLYTKKRPKLKFKRYFQSNIEKNIDKSYLEDESIYTRKSLDKSNLKIEQNCTSIKQEEELSQKTGYYNRQLNDKPNNIEVWIEYAQFQDTVYQFEKAYRKGSIAKAQRVLAERKLSILDKALTFNPLCELLLRERLKVAVSAYPADELQNQLKILVEHEKGNIILWQGYIEATQCSMSHCNTQNVIGLYSKCLSTLHQLRRSTVLEKYLLEENILRMLYQCGLFLKQAGLFEQLWTLLRMYLELNLSPNDKTKFNIASGFNEKQLVELEEIIFSSQLPLHELWLRTEKLRESCHWLPYLEDDVCEDPQRLVFTEDVSELIHPITMPENIFKLTATIFTLLKIPLLPCRHCTMQDLGLDYVPWSLDSIEFLLPVFLPPFPLDVIVKNLLYDNTLAVGPQYLKVLPGQEEYLRFILTVMKNCAECLNGDDKTAIIVWWFRFQRLLIILDKNKRFKMTPHFKNQIKKNIKFLLKQEQNRQNKIFYLEYALIEYELDDKQNCLNILDTALSLNGHIRIVSNNWNKFQTIQCCLYRMIVQITFTFEDDRDTIKNKCLKHLCALILQKKDIILTRELLNEAEVKFNCFTSDLLQNEIEKLQPLFNFLPDFFTDWIMCHGWFIYLTKGAIDCGVFIEKTLEHLEKSNRGPLLQKEILLEFYVAILFKNCVEQPETGIFKILDEVLHKAIKNYPNNLFLLSILAKEQSFILSSGPQWWKIQDMLLATGRACPILFAIIIANQKIIHFQEKLTDPIAGEKYDIDTNLKNRMLSLFKKVTKSDVCTRRCGLVWRLYLQFVYNYFSPNLCRNVYYSAVEECPWLKALYVDAAIYIPAELSQIQDLIIEKLLRLHVTPEELDVLRS